MSPPRLNSGRTLVAAFVLVGVTTLAACGGSDGEERSAELDGLDPSDRVVVVTSGRSYEPAVFVVEGPTEIVLENESGEFHDLRVSRNGFFLDAPAGQSDTDTLDLPPGDYTFFCSIPGHRPAGMEGAFRVL